MRQYETGATRDTDQDKLDYEGFLSPLVLERYAQYMHQHRIQADGNLRDSDNWQKGIPKEDYMKSMWRHFMDVFKNHRGVPADEDMSTALCAVLFNASGYLHELLGAEKELRKLSPIKCAECGGEMNKMTGLKICIPCLEGDVV